MRCSCFAAYLARYLTRSVFHIMNAHSITLFIPISPFTNPIPATPSSIIPRIQLFGSGATSNPSERR